MKNLKGYMTYFFFIYIYISGLDFSEILSNCLYKKLTIRQSRPKKLFIRKFTIIIKLKT